MTPMLLDTIVGIVILLSTVIALWRGFVKEALTIISLLGGAAGAYFLGPLMTGAYRSMLGAGEGAARSGEKVEKIWGMIPPDLMANFLAYATGFFGAFLILMLAGMSISGAVKGLGLGPVDKILGIVFGALRGFLLVFLIYLPFGYLMPVEKMPSWAKESISVTMLDKTYQGFDERMNEDKDKKKEDEKPVDPDSIEGKLLRMEQRLKEPQPAEADRPGENTDGGGMTGTGSMNGSLTGGTLMPDEEGAMP